MAGSSGRKSTKVKALKGKKTTKAEAEGVRGGARKLSAGSGKLLRSQKYLRSQKLMRSQKD